MLKEILRENKEFNFNRLAVRNSGDLHKGKLYKVIGELKDSVVFIDTVNKIAIIGNAKVDSEDEALKVFKINHTEDNLDHYIDTVGGYKTSDMKIKIDTVVIVDENGSTNELPEDGKYKYLRVVGS